MSVPLLVPAQNEAGWTTERVLGPDLLLKRINPGHTEYRRPFLKPVVDHLLSDSFYIGLNLLHACHR